MHLPGCAGKVEVLHLRSENFWFITEFRGNGGRLDTGTPPPLGVWTCKACKDPHEH